eukprot:1140961-Pelagomonas_calceolata.AAC.5
MTRKFDAPIALRAVTAILLLTSFLRVLQRFLLFATEPLPDHWIQPSRQDMPVAEIAQARESASEIKAFLS